MKALRAGRQVMHKRMTEKGIETRREKVLCEHQDRLNKIYKTMGLDAAIAFITGEGARF